MDKKRLEWRVGMFVFVGLSVLAVLLVQFSRGTSLFKPTYNLYLVAKNVGGLKPRAGILMAGVQVGTVSEIELNPQGTNVTITLKIYKKFEIRKDALFLIEQSGFLGDQYVAILPTGKEGDSWQPGGHPSADEPFNLQEVARSAAGFLQRINDTTKRLDDIIADVRRRLLNEETLTNLATAIGSLRTASDHALNTVDNLDGLITSNRQSVADAVSNVVYLSDQLNVMAVNLKGVLGTNGDILTASMKNVESSSEVLKDVLSDVKAGKGLAGTLLENQQLATNLQAIASNLSVTTSNLNRLGLWHFLWHHEVPATNAPPSRNSRSK